MHKLRKLVGRIPGAWTLYTAVRRVRWEFGAVWHGIRTGRVRALVARGATRRIATQRARHASGAADVLATGVYPPDAAVVALSVRPEQAQDRARVANLLAAEGAGPRLYDWVEVGGSTAFVQAGAVPSRPEAIGDLVAAGRLAPRAGVVADAPDFERYDIVDPGAEQRRIFDDEARRRLHFGREYALRGRYLYQSVPSLGESGRRSTLDRWGEIERRLGDAGVRIADRLILDVGCNAGMMLAAGLSAGATWGLGWDMPDVAALGERALHGLGFTRFDLFGASLGPGYVLGDDVPVHLRPALDGCVILYLAIRHHIGFTADLGTLPWRALVYEGSEDHELEDLESLERTLAPLRETCDFRIASATAYRDGEGQARPLAVLIRD